MLPVVFAGLSPVVHEEGSEAIVKYENGLRVTLAASARLLGASSSKILFEHAESLVAHAPDFFEYRDHGGIGFYDE